MVRHIILSNLKIYNIATELMQLQQTEKYQNYLYPVRVMFYLNKNINIILDLAQEIENIKIDILEKFKDLNADSLPQGQIAINPDYLDEANQEINDLFNLTQEIIIYTIDLEAFGDMNMTPAEISALSYMITETYEGEE